MDLSSGPRDTAVPTTLPPFALLIPLEHQSRDFLPRSTWDAMGHAAETLMRNHGLTLLDYTYLALDLPTAPPAAVERDRHSTVPRLLLTNHARIRYGTELVERGWTVVKHAMTCMTRVEGGGGAEVGVDGAAVSSGSSTPPTKMDPVGDFLHSVINKFPGEAALKDDDPMWTPIHNVDLGKVDETAMKRGQGRLTVRQLALAANGDDKDADDLYKTKLHCDMLMAAMAHQVLVGAQTAQQLNERPLVRVPKSGARVLLTTSRAVRQQPHVDATVRAEKPDPPTDQNADDSRRAPLQTFSRPRSHNYFAMAAGKDGFTVVVYPGSFHVVHRLEKKLDVPHLVRPERVVVPAGGLLVVRADVAHCGAGHEDDLWRLRAAPALLSYSHSIRLHLYLQRFDEPLQNAIYKVPGWLFGEGTGAPCLEPSKCKNCGEMVYASDVEDAHPAEGADVSDTSSRDKDDQDDAEDSQQSSSSDEDYDPRGPPTVV